MTDRYSLLNIVKERLYSATLVLIVLGVYVRTLLPGIGYSGDTAKFQFVGKVLGTAHESGEPGYLMLNYLFVTFFPWGSFSFKANLLSAVFAAAAIVVLFLLLQRISVRRPIAFFTALTFAVTYTFWSQSVIAEVYTLNILFVGLTILFFIRWHQTLQTSDFFLGCTVYAFSFGNHLSMITFLPALLFLVWRTRKEYFWNVRIVISVAGIIAIAAAQYGYLFWRTYAHDTSYLEIAVTNLKDLWYYASGGQFQEKMLSGGLNKAFFVRTPIMLRLAWLEYSVLLPAVFLGFFIIRDSTVRIFFIFCAAGTFLFTCLYGIPDIFVYMLPFYYILAVTLGISMEWLASRCTRGQLILFQLTVACVPFLFLSVNFHKADQSSNEDARTAVEQLLQTVGSKSLIVCPDYDWGEYFWYYVFAEEYRKDSVYVLYAHDAELPIISLEKYVREGQLFPLPVQRCSVPAGLTVYYCTATGGRSFDLTRSRYPSSVNLLRHASRVLAYQPMLHMIHNGFRFTPVGVNMYRIDTPSP